MIYESVFVFSGQLSEKIALDKFNQYIKTIEDAGGKILKKESWGLRELSYKIRKNSRGYYFMINSECKSDFYGNIQIKVKQDDSFLRFLNIKIKSVSDLPSPLDEKNREKTKHEK